MKDLSKIDAVILCGGLGTRLRGEIGESQKVMADFAGEPFLDILLQYVADQGIKRVVLCTGFKGETVAEHYKNQNFGLEISFSQEDEPLGTAGAIKLAQNMIQSDPFVVLNGDSYCAINLADFVQFHKELKASASVVVSEVDDTGGFGSVVLNDLKQIIEFKEKDDSSTTNMVNAGIYVFNKDVFSGVPEGKSSLEQDVFPQLTEKGLFGFLVGEEFIDIGTPERFKQAQDILKKD